MGMYAKYVVPTLTHLSMRQEQLRPYRQRVVSGATGRVVELGFGSGLNLPFYPSQVQEIVGIDVSPEMLALAQRGIGGFPHKVTLIARSAENIPLDAASADTVVITWSLCCIPNPSAALKESRRILKPGGQLRFVEHGLSPDDAVRKWQNRVTPIWRCCAGGCHLKRKTDDLVRAAGFQLTELSTGYARGPRMMAYMYEGSATV
jgi:ubiquinone/menaquinone biosynthesis C-methylase UbiE